MKFKLGFIFICLIICLFSIASVCAADVNETLAINDDSSEDVMTIENEDLDNVSVTEENKLSATTGTFTDLANDIANAGDELNLTRNYCHNINDDIISGITIEKQITINGNGFTIDGNKKTSAFRIFSEVTLNNISFINCNYFSVLSSQNAVTKILNCNFEKTQISYSGYTTGAIVAASSNCSIINCIFRDNSGSEGGAIKIRNNVLISNCSFINNVASNYGGAIALYDSNNPNIICNITGCDFINNVASNYGGAIALYDSNNPNIICNITGCDFRNNYALNGGAIYIVNNSVSINNCYFENNSADSEGAVYVRSNYNIIKDCSFILNNAYYGGAIIVQGNNNTINSCNFSNNSKIGSYALAVNGENNLINFSIFEYNIHGALYAPKTTTINSSIFKYNSNNNDYGGGAITFSPSYNINIPIIVTNCSFIGNTAKNGGAIYFYSGTSETIFKCCNFINNSARNRGNAICFNTGRELKLFACNFCGENYETNDYIYVEYDKKITPYFIVNNKNIFIDEYFNLIIDIPCSKGIATIYQYDDQNNCYFNKSYNMTINGGKINYTLSNSHYGKNYINIEYYGDSLFIAKNQSFIYYVLKYPTNLFFNVTNITWGDSIILSPIVNQNVTGKFKIYVDEQFINEINVGENYNLTYLDGGKHNITIIYGGDDYFESSQLSKEWCILKLNTTYSITGNIEAGDYSTVYVNLNKDARGSVELLLDKNSYYDILDSNGSCIFNVHNLRAGIYDVTLIYHGDSKYDSFTKDRTLNVTLKKTSLTLNLKRLN